MTLAQKAAWHEKVSRRMAQMSIAEKIRALKEARKEKASAEGTPEQETRMTPMEMMLAIRAAAEEKEKIDIVNDIGKENPQLKYDLYRNIFYPHTNIVSDIAPYVVVFLIIYIIFRK